MTWESVSCVVLTAPSVLVSIPVQIVLQVTILKKMGVVHNAVYSVHFVQVKITVQIVWKGILLLTLEYVQVVDLIAHYVLMESHV